jgi:hypothetical protein
MGNLPDSSSGASTKVLSSSGEGIRLSGGEPEFNSPQDRHGFSVCSLVWLKARASGARDRMFESSHTDHL